MAAKQLILLIEDDRRLGNLIKKYLEKQGFDILIERRGDSAPHRIIKEKPNIVVLDLMLPGMDGFSVCQSVRSEYRGPILILTAREDDMDQVAGLEMGADDYVKKPVKPRVLLARIRALLRRFDKTEPAVGAFLKENDSKELRYGNLKISLRSHSVSLNRQTVELTTNEFDLLWFLANNAGSILDRNTIYRSLRGIDYDGLDRSVDLTVSRLRKKLEKDADHPKRIKTVWGQGYLFTKDAW
jgi:DNA-binding response OmpR family regulator